MKKLSQLLESVNEIDSLLEIDFKDKESFQKYQAKHKMRPTTKVNIAGKDTTVGDETGNKPKSEPKLKNNLVKGLQSGLNPSKDSGLIKQTLDKLGDYPELKDKIDNLVDYIDNNSVGASEEEIERIKEKENEVRNDIIKALSDEPKSDEPKKLSSDAKKALSDIEADFEPYVGLSELIRRPDSTIRNKVVGHIKSTENFNGYIRRLYSELEESGVSQEELSTLEGLEVDSDNIINLSDVPQDELVSKVKQLGKLIGRLGVVKKENFDLRQLSKITTRYNK